MGEGKPQHTQPSDAPSQAEANAAQDAIHDMAQWNTGQPKEVSENAYDGVNEQAAPQDTPLTAKTTPDDLQAGTVDSGGRHGEANPVSYGGYRDGLPASGAATHPDKTVDADENI